MLNEGVWAGQVVWEGLNMLNDSLWVGQVTVEILSMLSRGRSGDGGGSGRAQWGCLGSSGDGEVLSMHCGGI